MHLTKGSLAEGVINGEILERDRKELNHLLKRREELLNFISKFDDLDSQILKLKYVEGMKLTEIADELAYSESYIRLVHTRLVKTIRSYDKFLLESLP